MAPVTVIAVRLEIALQRLLQTAVLRWIKPIPPRRQQRFWIRCGALPVKCKCTGIPSTRVDAPEQIRRAFWRYTSHSQTDVYIVHTKPFRLSRPRRWPALLHHLHLHLVADLVSYSLFFQARTADAVANTSSTQLVTLYYSPLLPPPNA